MFIAATSTVPPRSLSSRTAHRLAFGVIGAFTLVTMLAVPAVAQYPPAQGVMVACTPMDPASGVSVTCTVAGAPANTDLDIRGDINPVLLATTTTTDRDGQAGFGFDVPTDVQAGEVITITVSGQELDGSLVIELTVGSSESTDAAWLPDTGGEFRPLVLVGLACAAVGVGAVVAGRRRERARTGT